MTGKRGVMEGGRAMEGRGGEGWKQADWKEGKGDAERMETGNGRRNDRRGGKCLSPPFPFQHSPHLSHICPTTHLPSPAHTCFCSIVT